MPQIPLESIAERVRQTFAASPFADDVREVRVEPADDLSDDPMLRVLVTLRKRTRVDADAKAANELVRRLQLDLVTDDDRFLIFQFPEAA